MVILFFRCSSAIEKWMSLKLTYFGRHWHRNSINSVASYEPEYEDNSFIGEKIREPQIQDEELTNLNDSDSDPNYVANSDSDTNFDTTNLFMAVLILEHNKGRNKNRLLLQLLCLLLYLKSQIFS